MASLEQQLLLRTQQLQIIQKGNFKLTSGQTASYYIDGRSLSLDSQASRLIGQIINNRLSDKVRSIGGPATGAIALVAATLAVASDKRNLRGFYIRSSTRLHGLQRNLEGHVVSPAVIVDDVCTTGNSLLKVADILQSQGVVIDSILTVFNRDKIASQTITKHGYKYSAIFSCEEGDLGLY